MTNHGFQCHAVNASAAIPSFYIKVDENTTPPLFTTASTNKVKFKCLIGTLWTVRVKTVGYES